MGKRPKGEKTGLEKTGVEKTDGKKRGEKDLAPQRTTVPKTHMHKSEFQG